MASGPSIEPMDPRLFSAEVGDRVSYYDELTKKKEDEITRLEKVFVHNANNKYFANDYFKKDPAARLELLKNTKGYEQGFEQLSSVYAERDEARTEADRFRVLMGEEQQLQADSAAAKEKTANLEANSIRDVQNKRRGKLKQRAYSGSRQTVLNQGGSDSGGVAIGGDERKTLLGL